jgi:hypothetical protein
LAGIMHMHASLSEYKVHEPFASLDLEKIVPETAGLVRAGPNSKP